MVHDEPSLHRRRKVLCLGKEERRMSDLIDRKHLIKNLNRFAPEHYSALINSLILKEPTVEAEPVRHGFWIKYPDTLSHDIDCVDEDDVICSECGKTVVLISQTSSKSYKFCPYCGARMDGEEE